MENIDNNSAIGLMKPIPYVLVTSLDKEGKPNALGVAAVSMISRSPFLIIVSIAHGRYSHEGIAYHKEFVVCYPSAEQEKGAMICGTKSGRDGDKLDKAGLVIVPSLKVKPPTIKDSTVAFECKLYDSHVAGDHTLFIGEVVAITGTPGKEKHLFLDRNYKPFAMDQNGKV
jgi:flavin reductase (DIM6/NTAB) family NADH-FMN oxidoreductase RutF